MTYDELAKRLTDMRGTADIGDFSRCLNLLGVDTGKNREFAWFRERGYVKVMSGGKNSPVQSEVNSGYMKQFEDVECSDGKLRPVTRLTPKGLLHYLCIRLGELGLLETLGVE